MKNSRPLPPTLIETEDLDDPATLSITNTIWLERGLHPDIVNVLSHKGISHFTPVQAEAFLPVLARRDVIGRSRTGTGKTLAFGIPALLRLVEHTEKVGKRINGKMQRGRLPSMLVLCPTRELARQVQEELQQIARPLGLYTEVFHGGVSYDPQSRALRQGLDVLVGTPGRIIDHIERGNLDLRECDIVVLDEADE
jgi:ATP-dependent RNA helicase DDX21